MIAVVVETKETPCPCLSAKEARELTASTNSKVCRAIMTRADEAIRLSAERGTNFAQVLIYQHEGSEAVKFAVAWLIELGYDVTPHPTAIAIRW